MTEDQRKKVVAIGFDRFKQQYEEGKPKRVETEFDRLIGKLLLLNKEVSDFIRPAIANGAMRDKGAFEDLLLKLYLHSMTKFSKDEMEQLCAWMLTSTAMTNLYPETLGTDPKLPDNAK